MKTVYLHNLPYAMKVADLDEMLRAGGLYPTKLLVLRWLDGPYAGLGKGVAFAQFATDEEAERAVQLGQVKKFESAGRVAYMKLAKFEISSVTVKNKVPLFFREYPTTRDAAGGKSISLEQRAERSDVQPSGRTFRH